MCIFIYKIDVCVISMIMCIHARVRMCVCVSVCVCLGRDIGFNIVPPPSCDKLGI